MVGVDPRLGAVRYVSLGTGTGYGDAADQYMTGLRGAGVDVHWTRVVEGGSRRGDHPSALRADPDVVVVHLPPPWFGPSLDDHPRVPAVAMLAWETQVVPDDWPSFDRFRLVLVPSSFTAATLAPAAPDCGVEVVPHIARRVNPVPGARFGQIADQDFVFYTIGTWSTRKALAETVRAFLDTFTADDDVGLVVKTTALDYQTLFTMAGTTETRTPIGMVWWTVASIIADYPRPPRLHLITDVVTACEIDQLHTRGDCYLSLTRSEGWGLTSFDAALFGNPSIITGWGGHVEYLGSDYPLLVDYELRPTTDDRPDGWTPLRPHDRWAQADRDHAGRLMRWVYEHRAEAADLGAALRARVSVRYSADQVTTRLVDLLAGAAS